MNLFFSLLLFISYNLIAENLVSYSDDILEHKQKCSKIYSSRSKKDNSYPLSRVLLTITANDTDHINKVPDAGKIFEQNGISYQLMHNGIKILKDCYYGSWMSDIIYALKGHHEPQEEKIFDEVLKYIPSNATMIELGSYWGYYSLWFSTKIKDAKNYLIEPVLSNMEIGKKNFELNNKKGFFYQGYIPKNEKDKIIFSNAKIIQIDSFLEEQKIDHVNILHSDIQGAEYEMLKSCKNAIQSKKIDYFFVSTHSPRIHKSCRELLLAHSYIIIAEHTMSESCSVDGLIVARRKGLCSPEYISIKKYSS